MGAQTRRRLRGLDGLRALAVLGVVVFHLDSQLVPGGFLGVDVFFVISGVLITRLIALEVIDTGTLGLCGFFIRRARRLLPAVLVLLAAVSLGSWLVWPDQLPSLAGAVLSSLAYVTNWWLIADNQSYFVFSGRPSMLQHLWSLAIEEQFYLIWSAVLLGAAMFLGRDGRRITGPRLARVIAPLALLLAAGATAWSTVLAVQSDLPYGGSTSRVYFGADTHAAGLFLGSMAGVLAAATATRTVFAVRSRRGAIGLGITDGLGFLALAALGWQFLHVDEFRPALYRGGFTLIAFFALIAVVCAVRRHSALGSVLELRPLRWLGERSYSIYLWHWPIAIVTRPGYDVHGNETALNLARLALIVVVAHLSYRWIETPIRSGRVSVRAIAALARPRAGLAFARLQASVWMSTPRTRWAPRLPRVSSVLGAGVAAAAAVCLMVAVQSVPKSAAVALQLGASSQPVLSGTAPVSPPADPSTSAGAPVTTGLGMTAAGTTAPGTAAAGTSAAVPVP
ncbi:MAG: acyltransferase, partial [Jatrophihabitantaceae bacterium]|nr:acyltransferase [Jatrophihabitantaceae bacterium]